jgi:hypothetical protein
MKLFYWSLLLVAILIVSCSEAEEKSKNCYPECGDYQECINAKCELKSNRCDYRTDCLANEVCNVSHECVEFNNPCDGVTCSNNGNCIILDAVAKCNCNIGYKENALECVEDECNAVTCDNHGSCEVVNNNAICNCYEGYHSDGVNCVINANPWDGITCSEHGTCNDSTGTAICTCELGYYVDGTDCLKEGSPCDGVDCGNGICNESTGNAVCECDTGYHSEGLKCIQDSNPCDSVSCGNGVCVTDNDNNSTCNCSDGYILQGLTCVKISDPCDNQNCSNKGSCENIDGAAKCNCDDGYSDEGLECIKVAVVDWCKVVGPTSINATVGGDEISVFAQIFSQGLTEDIGANSIISGGLGYTSQDILYPIDNAQFTWVDASFNESCNDCGFNDEYSAALPTTTIGNFKYIFRFSIDNGYNWSYCDLNSMIEGEGFNPG